MGTFKYIKKINEMFDPKEYEKGNIDIVKKSIAKILDDLQLNYRFEKVIYSSDKTALKFHIKDKFKILTFGAGKNKSYNKFDLFIIYEGLGKPHISINDINTESFYIDKKDKEIKKELLNFFAKYMKDDIGKSLKKFNEYIEYEDIIINDNDFIDKEDDIIKMHLDNLSDYNKKKNILQDMFENIEEEIDNASVFKLIEDNIFLKQYVSLLTKVREKLIIERTIEQKEESIEVIRNELKNELIEDEGQIEEKEDEIKELEDRLNKLPSMDILFNKWESNLSKIERDLEKGKPLSISLLTIR